MVPAPERSQARLTQEEFRRWLDEQPPAESARCELLNGCIVKEPPAGWRHGSVGAALVELLRSHVRGRHLGVVFDASTGIELPSGDTVEPDVSFVARAQLDNPTATAGSFLRAVPTLVVEILSASTARRDRGEKKAIYERNGILEYWLVDPTQHEVTIFRLQGSSYGSGARLPSGRLQSTVLPDLVIELETIFEL